MQNRRAGQGLIQRLTDPGYRLPGESAAHATLEDARRWSATYDELVRFKRELLELCHKFMDRSGPDVARAIREADMVLLEMEASRFEQRRDYWKIRAAELAGNGRRGVAT